jgi:predicted secreted protein
VSSDLFTEFTALFFTFIMSWWLIFLMALPFGLRRPGEAGETVPTGTDRGAPLKAMIRTKALIVTPIAVVVTAAIYLSLALGVFAPFAP